MNSITTFCKGPGISITLEFEKGSFRRASLDFSEKFKCRVAGDADSGQLEQCLCFLEAYSKGLTSEIDLPFHLSPFREHVLTHLKHIPFGSLVTYGELATLAGSPRAARAVGSACHHNPYPLFIPCHRVVASGGKPGGFAYDLKMKLLLLDFETSLKK